MGGSTASVKRVGVFAAVALLLAACSGDGGGPKTGKGTAGPIHRGGDLIIARTADSQTMDKTQMFDNESIWVVTNLYEMLYEAAPDGKTLVPWLATSYELTTDQLTWTFHLRSGVKFHNGQPLTAADVKFSLDNARAKESAWAFIDAAIDEVSTPDDATVVIRTKFPWAPLLADLALFGNGIIPKDYGGQTKEQFYQHPVGTGPFMWDHWTKGQELKLVKNPDYWQKGKPYLDSVTWTNVPDDNTRILQLKGGQAHVDEFPPWSSVSSLRSAPGVVMKLFPSSRTDFLQFNQKRKPFDDVHVRRAIAFAIDRDAMIKAVLFGNGTSANSFLTPALFGYDRNVQGPQYDPAKAKQEMAQSSVPNGFKTTLMVGSGAVTENSLAQIVQQELQALHIDVTLRKVDVNAEFTNIQNFDYDIAFTYDTTDIIDPDELMGFSVGGLPGGTYSLWTNYNDKEVNDWIAQAAHNFDKATRQDLYTMVQTKVAQDAPLVPLFYSPYAYAFSDKLQGFLVYPTGNYHLENAWISA